MNTKIQLEIQRISNALDETIEDFEILQCIPKYYTDIPEHIQKKLSNQSRNALLQLYEEEKMLKSKFDERKQSEVIGLSKLVKKSTIKACQLLKKVKYLDYIPVDTVDREKMEQFVRLMKDMRKVWVERLNTTEEEKQIENEQKKESSSREKKAMADKKALERELASEKSSRDKELSIREDTVKKYQNEYQKLLQETAQQKAEYTSNIELKEKQAQQKYERLRTLLLERIKKTKMLLSEMEVANKEKEGLLKLNRKNVEKQVEDTISEYDSYMSKTTLRVNTLMKEHKEDNVRLEFLKEELKKYEEDRKENEKEYQSIAEEKKKKENARKQRIDAANRIGRFYKKILEKREEQKRLEKLARKKKKGKGAKKSPAKRS